MFEFLYEWIRNIAFYMVLVTAALQVIPNHTYKRYIRFFTGMILILLLLTPVLKILHLQEVSEILPDESAYRKKIEEITETTEYLKEVQLEDYVKEAEKSEIEVEEIQIAP